MKIVNRVAFLALPDNTVYSSYQSLGMIEGLYIKEKTLQDDWLYQDLIDSVEAEDSDKFIDLMFAAEKGAHFTLDLECLDRDGSFEEAALFVIYDIEDLKKLVHALTQVLSTYPVDISVSVVPSDTIDLKREEE